jgi:hypothetical protein
MAIQLDEKLGFRNAILLRSCGAGECSFDLALPSGRLLSGTGEARAE